MKIGVIGTGIMGKPMARNLMAAGHKVVVHNRSRASVDELVAEGAAAAGTPREVAEQVDLVITMLPDGPDVEQVVLEADGVIEGAHDGLVLVDCSSIAPTVSQSVSKRLAVWGVAMVDAPVSGGEQGAIDGTLVVMVGGPEEVVERVRPVLEIIGSTVTRVGDIGAGNVAKLANNAIVAVNIAILGESLVLAAKAGVEPALVARAIAGGLAGSAVLEAKAPKMLSGDLKPGFTVSLHAKDLRNALTTAEASGAPMPLTEQVSHMLAEISEQGHASDDDAALVGWYERLAGIELSRN